MINMRHRLKNSVGLFTFSLLLLSLTSCRKNPTQSEIPALIVHVERLSSTSVAREFSYPGTIVGRKKITLSTKVMGQVASFSLEEGAKVERGQVIARIRSGDLEAKRLQVESSQDEATAALKNTETNYNRIKELYDRKSATQKELDDITMAYSIAKAKKTTTEEMGKEISDILGYATIISPISGSIVGKFVEEGDMANPGMPIVSVEDAQTLDANVSVTESEVYLFKRGDPVSVRVDALGPDAKVSGIVEQVNQAGDPATRQFHVKVRLMPSKEVSLKSGMYATVILSAHDTRNLIAISKSYLVRRGALDGVFIVDKENEALLRWVKTGKELANGRIEILSGLSGDELVVTSIDDRLRDGIAVKVAQ